MRKGQWRLRFSVGLATLLAATLPACATEATLVADAHVSIDRPTVNSGTISNLYVGSGFTSLLQFDLGTLPAGTTGVQITKAVLRLYCNRVDTTGSVSVSTVGGAWGEYSVTYAALPALGSAVQVVPVGQAGAYVTVDVTSVVQGWVQTPATNNGLALSSATSAVQFDSKENDLTAHAATLDITLAGQGAAGAVGATGAAGPAGPQGPAGAVGPAGATGVKGDAGPAGSGGLPGLAGPAGAVGPSGPAGPAGAIGAKGNPGLGYVGVYQSTMNYGLADVVGYQGSSYISLTEGNHGNTPSLSTAQWGLIAQAQVGPQGPVGVAGAAGATGATGPAGLPGLPGPTGSAGPTGPQGLPGLTYQGSYSAGTNYTLGDIVLWNGTTYTSLGSGNHGNTPDASPLQWGILSSQGLAGPTGAPGLPGPAGPQGLPGSVGPNGEQGPQGVQGIAGQGGAQGLVGLTGPAGPQGNTGAQGSIGPVGLRFRGAYTSSSNYGQGDGVAYNGAGYVSLVPSNVGNTPGASPAQWSMFAAAGSNGATGTSGVAGPEGAIGPQGAPGVSGPAGPTGITGPQGPAVATFVGTYSSAVNYRLNDAVSFAGSTYLSMSAGNRGNVPDQSPDLWTMLVARGPAGDVGAAGTPGAAGPSGPAGVAGPSGAQGPPVSFAGGWTAGRAYAVGDAVSYGGSSFIAVQGNNGRQPDLSPLYWGLLAQSGLPGVSGPAGPQGPVGPTGVGLQGPAGAQGTTGLPGASGPAGPTGANGVAGPVGPAGPAGVAGMAYRGTYASTQNYGFNDAVSYRGATYISTSGSNQGNTPDATPAVWSIFAAAGADGASGTPGAAGAQGVAGVQGPAGAQGSMGPAGAAGADGATGLHYMGAFSSATNYALNDGVVWGGSMYLSLAAGNRGNAPDASSTWWGLLAKAGASGVPGAAGVAGPAGPIGAAGPTGVTGLTGAAGQAGMVYRGAWASGTNYQVGDAVLFAGSTYLAQMSNSASQPDLVPSAWSVLAQQGSAGPTGPTGIAGTVQVGAVTTGPEGSAATVTNSGTATAAVLNFTIPQGATGPSGSGSGGTTGAATSGIPFQSTYHAVSYLATYYSVNSGSSAQNESGGAVLTWVPAGCTATKLTLYSQQANAVTVTLRQGIPGGMASTALACTATTNSSCTATGSVSVANGGFVDLMISGANGTTAGVWTALACN